MLWFCSMILLCSFKRLWLGFPKGQQTALWALTSPPLTKAEGQKSPNSMEVFWKVCWFLWRWVISRLFHYSTDWVVRSVQYYGLWQWFWMMEKLDGCHLLSFFIYSTGLCAWFGHFINPDSTNACVCIHLVLGVKLTFPSAETMCSWKTGSYLKFSFGTKSLKLKLLVSWKSASPHYC